MLVPYDAATARLRDDEAADSYPISESDSACRENFRRSAQPGPRKGCRHVVKCRLKSNHSKETLNRLLNRINP